MKPTHGALRRNVRMGCEKEIFSLYPIYSCIIHNMKAHQITTRKSFHFRFASHSILFHFIPFCTTHLLMGNACSNSNNNNLLLQQSSVLAGNILTWISTLWFRIDVNQRLRCVCTLHKLPFNKCGLCTVHCTLYSTLKWFDAMRCDLRVPTTKSKSCPSTEIPIKLQ